jgi:predicted LPLAT superfamily acyltransferase
MSTPQWDGKGKGSTLGNRLFMGCIRRCGVVPAYGLLFPACVSYALLDRGAKAALRSFRTHLGLRSGIVALYRHFYTFGMSLVDRFAFLMLRSPRFGYTCIGEEIITDELAKGGGAILLSAHVGNWELAGNLLHDRVKAPINVAMVDAEREALRQVYRPATDQRRLRIIGLGDDGLGAMVEINAALGRNELVGFLGDRVLPGAQGVSLPFLGENARFPQGPFVVALLSGAPIIPVFTLKTGLRRYTFRAHTPIHLPRVGRDKRDEVLRKAMMRYVATLESVVREHPYQWFNFYGFWD